jgi:hypothetical protein
MRSEGPPAEHFWRCFVEERDAIRTLYAGLALWPYLVQAHSMAYTPAGEADAMSWLGFSVVRILLWLMVIFDVWPSRGRTSSITHRSLRSVRRFRLYLWSVLAGFARHRDITDAAN